MTHRNHVAPTLVAALAALVLSVTPAAAQAPSGSTDGHASRAELEEMLSLYEQGAASPAYSAALRAEANALADALRDRLTRGDFQPGDRILLRVEGNLTLSDTFTVAAGPALELPEIGHVPLTGVLRAELQDTLNSTLQRFLRDPNVTAGSLIRISITGGVGIPGFHVLQSQAVLSDALMIAGGLLPDALLDRATIRRGERVVLAAEDLSVAMADGRTLDQLGLRAGDRLHVPTPSPAGDRLGSMLFIIPSLLTILTLFL